ncbi:hypothetical protein [Streptomyces sp. NPDC047928]|uniref:hypothetical protein n=1 Tax=unclassified Streptomyces TaxID=2593676 RepID=UPI00372432BD
MRPAQDGPSAPSATPIYDALYSEYLRAFRTLPGDRSGEEDLGFKAFGIAPYSGRTGPVGAYSSHGHGVGYQSQTQSGGPYAGYAAARPHAGHTGHLPLPAALPPAPRRGL